MESGVVAPPAGRAFAPIFLLGQKGFLLNPWRGRIPVLNFLKLTIAKLAFLGLPDIFNETGLKMIKYIAGMAAGILFCFACFAQDTVNATDVTRINKLEACIYAVKGYRHSPNTYVVNGNYLTFEQLKEKLMTCEESEAIVVKHPYSFKAINYYNYYCVFNGGGQVSRKLHRNEYEKSHGINRYGVKRDIRMLRRAVRRFNQSLSR